MNYSFLGPPLVFTVFNIPTILKLFSIFTIINNSVMISLYTTSLLTFNYLLRIES